MTIQINKECATCEYLGICKITSGQKILSHYVCEHYVGVQNPEIVKARLDVISKFGDAGIKAVAPKESIKED